MSVKETMLKLFALFLKAENPANTDYMKEKYKTRMRQFIERCEMAEELNDLAEEKLKKTKKEKINGLISKKNIITNLGKSMMKFLLNHLKKKLLAFRFI